MSDYHHPSQLRRMNRIAEEEDEDFQSPSTSRRPAAEGSSSLRRRSTPPLLTVTSPPNKENRSPRMWKDSTSAQENAARRSSRRSVSFSPDPKSRLSNFAIHCQEALTRERMIKEDQHRQSVSQHAKAPVPDAKEEDACIQPSIPSILERSIEVKPCQQKQKQKQCTPQRRPAIARDRGTQALMKDFYQGPTHLHEICNSMATIEDVLTANRYFLTSPTRDVSTAASRKDDDGRLPMHILSENSKLSGALFAQEDSDKIPILQQSPSTLDDSETEKQVICFALDILLSAHPNGMIWKDSDGFIPFEKALVDWVRSVHETEPSDQGKRGSNRTLMTQGQNSAFQHVWQSTSTSLSTVLHTWPKRSLHFTNMSDRSMEDENDPESDDLENGTDASGSEALDAKSIESWTFQYFPGGVNLTAHARFAIKMLSLILDKLGENVLSHSFKRRSLVKHRENPESLQTDSFDAAMDDLREFCSVEDSGAIASEVVRIIASIPNLMKTVLLLDDEVQREWVLSTSLFQSVALSKHSIGTWLTATLQNPRKKVSGCGQRYLEYVSQTLGAHEEAQRNNFKASHAYDELQEEVSKLEGFIPSLLSLGERGMEESATTLLVRRVLDTMIVRPFAVSVVFFDALFLAILIVSFRAAVNSFLNGKPPDTVLKWIYVANAGIFYFIIRELGKCITIMERTRTARVYFLSFWNIADILSTVLALCSTIAIRVSFGKDNIDLDDTNQLRGLLAVTTGFLWLRVFSLLKAINMQLATFVLAIIQITRDILWFLLILFATVVSFAQMFYTLLAPASCATGDSVEGDRSCSQAEYYLRTYTILLGDFGTFERDSFPTSFSIFLMVIFSFMVVVVLLNVLIAIVSDSYEKCLMRSHSLFGRARVMLIAELVSFQNLLKTSEDRPEDLHLSNNLYSKWWSGHTWNHDWSRGSLVFFFLSTSVVLIWIIGETAGYFSGQQHGNFIFSIGSILVNVFLYVAIIAFLSNSSAATSSSADREEESSKAGGNRVARFVFKWYQRVIQKGIMLRLLGSTMDASSFFKQGDTEDWRGRAYFLQREMARIAEESNALLANHSKEVELHVAHSESRLRSEVHAVEQRMQTLTEELHKSEERSEEKLRRMMNELLEAVKGERGEANGSVLPSNEVNLNASFSSHRTTLREI